MEFANDTISLKEVGRTLRREIRWVIGGVGVGLACGLLALLLLRPQYEGIATVLLRTDSGSGGSSMSFLAGLDVPGLSDILPDALGSGMDTELEILASRSLLGSVVDSLYLQARMRSPRDIPVNEVFIDARFEPRLPRGTYSFRRTNEGYEVQGRLHRGIAQPGQPYSLPGAVVTLSPGSLPDEFKVQLMRREKSIEVLSKKLVIDEAGGDIAELVYRADNEEMAAAVPNAMVAVYLHRKKTTDRGLNQHRYEFLSERVDSIGVEVEIVEAQLRSHQENTQVIDPQVVGTLQLEGLMAIRARLEEVQVEARSLRHVMMETGESGSSARRFAAFPTLLESPAVNELVSQLTELETQLASRQERYTDRDPEVIAIRNSILQIEAQFTALATDYLSAVSQQEAELLTEMEGYNGQLANLPEYAQESFRLERDLRRLTQTHLALHAQMLDARIAAIGEGGEIRQIDDAVPADELSFPRPLPTLAITLFAGLLLGMVSALGRGAAPRRIRDAHDAESVANLPAVHVDRKGSLLIGGLDVSPTVLVLPIGSDAGAEGVAERIASTASRQGRAVTLMNLNGTTTQERLTPAVTASGGSANGGGAVATQPGDGEEYLVYRIGGEGKARSIQFRPLIEGLERESKLVVASLPPLDHPDIATVLSPDRRVILVGRAGTLERSELEGSLSTLRRLGIVVSGIVLTDERANGRRGD